MAEIDHLAVLLACAPQFAGFVGEDQAVATTGDAVERRRRRDSVDPGMEEAGPVIRLDRV